MPRKAKDLTGYKFGELLVLGREGSNDVSTPIWRCKCSCGNEARVLSSNLLKGAKYCSRTCPIDKENRTTHAGSATPVYKVWQHIKDRCTNERCPAYKYYGARGITMWEGWVNDFAAFRDYMGARPTAKHSVERKENDKGYEPGNVEWATAVTQANNRRSNRWLEHAGKRMTLTQWARELGIHNSTIYRRLDKGWSMDRVLSKEIENE